MDTIHHYVERSNGLRIHYWLTGPAHAPLLIFTHGATMTHRMFEQQVETFVQDFRVLTWDVRGHGLSRPLAGPFTLSDCADDLLALLDAVGAEKAILIGQSLGGYIAQYAYLACPERVQAMVIIGSTSIAMPYARWEIAAVKLSLPLLRLYPYGYLKRVIARSTAHTAEEQQRAYEQISQLNREEFLSIWELVTLAISERGIPGHQIRVPLLLTHGEHDNLGSIKRQAPRWAACEPNVEYTVIPRAGHNANGDNPEAFNRVLRTFLESRVLLTA